MCVTLTAAVQGNLCFKFLPFTPDGESARLVPVVSPLNLGLDLPRSHKLTSKRASTAVLVKLLSSRVLKILDAMTEHSVLQLCEAARASAEYLGQRAKRALQGFARQIQLTPFFWGSWTANTRIIRNQHGSWVSPCVVARSILTTAFLSPVVCTHGLHVGDLWSARPTDAR